MESPLSTAKLSISNTSWDYIEARWCNQDPSYDNVWNFKTRENVFFCDLFMQRVLVCMSSHYDKDKKKEPKLHSGGDLWEDRIFFFMNNLLFCENRSKKEIHSSRIESSSFCVVTKQNTKGNSDHKTKKDKSRLNPRSSSLSSTMTALWWRQDTNFKKKQVTWKHLQHVDFNYK